MHSTPIVRGIAFEIRAVGLDQIVEVHPPEKPYVYVPGSGEILPAIERAMEGAVDYEERTFIVPAEEAFGPYDPMHHATFPRAAFDKSVKLVPEARVQARTRSGSIQHMTILHVFDDAVRVDLNHPLAGKAFKVRARFIPIHTPSPTARFFGLPRGRFLH